MQRLRAFAYHEPRTVVEAAALLAAAGGGARVLAGGTDLVVDLKTRRVAASTVVNLKRIPGLAGIEQNGGGIRIGALTTVAAVERAEAIRAHLPALAEGASVLATPPVRNLATIGGNIGRASPASDLAPPLIVHEALAVVAGPDGERRAMIEGLFAGPGETTLAAHEIVTAVLIPLPAAGTGSAHRKIGARRGGTDIAVAGVSALVTLDGGLVASARIALASVAPTPIRARAAEAELVGRAPDDEAVAAAAAAAAAECRPIDDVRATAGYRRTVVSVLTARAVRAAAERARAGRP